MQIIYSTVSRPENPGLKGQCSEVKLQEFKLFLSRSLKILFGAFCITLIFRLHFGLFEVIEQLPLVVFDFRLPLLIKGY